MGNSFLSFLPSDINFIKLVLIDIVLIVLYITNEVIKFFYEKNLSQIKGELAILSLFLGFGVIMSLFQNDLFSIFLYLEIVSFCIYGFLFLQK